MNNPNLQAEKDKAIEEIVVKNRLEEHLKTVGFPWKSFFKHFALWFLITYAILILAYIAYNFVNSYYFNKTPLNQIVWVKKAFTFNKPEDMPWGLISLLIALPSSLGGARETTLSNLQTEIRKQVHEQNSTPDNNN